MHFVGLLDGLAATLRQGIRGESNNHQTTAEPWIGR
jgi:hypothetical protein